ncbi:MAG: acyltransferase family protein, partial [Clostridia bacterium]|nr:acyltransferase family protein [Clostridia bacterium]
MENKSVRNGTVDFLKFLFCVVIMLRHSEYALPQGTFDFLWRGAICVEFFFLVSGYLMACSAKRRLQTPKLAGIGDETITFMRRKIAILLPTLPLAVLISFVVTEISKQTTGILEWFRAFTVMLWDLLILPAAGFGNLNERWYIGCMLLVMFVFYPVMLKSFNVFIRIIAPLTAIFVLGYIYKNYGELVNPQLYLGHMYKGMLRAIGEIALGAAMYPLIEWLKKLRLTPFLKMLVTVTELVCVFVAVFLMFKAKRKDYDFFIM